MPEAEPVVAAVEGEARGRPAAAAALVVSIVTFRPDRPRLAATLDSLCRAAAHARRAGRLGEARLWLIDNTPQGNCAESLGEMAAGVAVCGMTLVLRQGQGNLGYGRAHNLALLGDRGEFHLVLNPDAELEEPALSQALGFMHHHPEIDLLAPAAFDRYGAPQYLCKRFPAVFDLMLRGFAPGFVKRMFARRLGRYELRDLIAERGETVVRPVPIVGGAFMLVRRRAIERTRGFDPQFFLYFEDFDWSLRLGEGASSAYVPSVRVIHHGGGAARKGLVHVGRFAASAWRFYRKHGWKFF